MNKRSEEEEWEWKYNSGPKSWEEANVNNVPDVDEGVINLKIRAELETQLQELDKFSKNCATQLLMAAKADNNLLLAETKGMLRTVEMVMLKVSERIEQLKFKSIQ